MPQPHNDSSGFAGAVPAAGFPWKLGLLMVLLWAGVNWAVFVTFGLWENGQVITRIALVMVAVSSAFMGLAVILHLRHSARINAAQMEPGLKREDDASSAKPLAAPHFPVEAENGDASAESEFGEAEFLIALHFPKTAEDERGFGVMEQAYGFEPMVRPLDAAKELLTVLSHMKLYLEDLPDFRVGAAFWGKLIAGQEPPLSGAEIDADIVARLSSHLKEDSELTRKAEAFHAAFRELLIEVADELTPKTLESLDQTRSGRAYLLIKAANG